MINGIIIDCHTFNTLSPATQVEIARAIGMSTGGAIAESDTARSDDRKLAKLTPPQVRRVLDRLSAKPKSVLRAISDYGPRVKLKMLMLEAGLAEFDDHRYKSVKSTLTKRTNKITGKSGTELIGYRDNYDGEGKYIDTDCWVSDKTHASLKAVIA
jgi:hypothetical protein